MYARIQFKVKRPPCKIFRTRSFRYFDHVTFTHHHARSWVRPPLGRFVVCLTTLVIVIGYGNIFLMISVTRTDKNHFSGSIHRYVTGRTSDLKLCWKIEPEMILYCWVNIGSKEIKWHMKWVWSNAITTKVSLRRLRIPPNPIRNWSKKPPRLVPAHSGMNGIRYEDKSLVTSDLEKAIILNELLLNEACPRITTTWLQRVYKSYS